ncbi:MAG: SMP-30/gluconolactonase/LRE family protein [Bacteroidota bacterium]
MKTPYCCWIILLGMLHFSCQPKDVPTNSPIAPTIELALQIDAQLGEGAFWNIENQTFYWVDIEGKRLHLFDPITGKNRSLQTPTHIGTVVPMNDNVAMVGLVDGAYLMNTETGNLKPYAKIDDNVGATRLNDGKCDPAGRLWVGSMHWETSEPVGSLYRVDGNEQATKILDSITVSNGIVWSKDRKIMYYIDTPTKKIHAFDYDMLSGEIKNERIAVVIADSLGLPDGMTIDADDKLWVGMWNGNAVCRFDPTSGQLMEQVEVPAHNVTSCAFGGPALDTLYITTASIDMTEEEKAQFPLAGSVFKYVPGVKGVPSDLFQLR